MHPKICLTASAFLVHQDKILLIKHKKLGIWLGPGGHIDADETPHQAAAREFLEETGLQVRARSAYPLPKAQQSFADVLHPLPFNINEHWVSEANYQARQQAVDDKQAFQPVALWSKGCERHCNFTYLVELDGPLEIKPAPGESQEIRFFTPAEVEQFSAEDCPDLLKLEISQAFELAKRLDS